ncbi:unnamed protein product [Linum tenue]|uniref:DUF7792 domain-containing protein n=1 Tax=Linum tenue TaxID=586396 RepID=A0AAV0NY74_9ROSI|nr:unnamed protein product [Linum tenue]
MVLSPSPPPSRGAEQAEPPPPFQDELRLPIILAERVLAAVDEADSFKSECSAVGKQADYIVDKLRSLVRFVSSPGQAVYERPVRRISAEVAKNLDRALALVRRCRRRNIFHRVVTMISAADFRKALVHLEASAGDVTWLWSMLESHGNAMALPPIASNDPIVAWVWVGITSIYMAPMAEKIEAANQLASLAKDNDRNKQIIVEEGGVPPFLKLIKEKDSPEAQIAAAVALFYLCNDGDRVRAISAESTAGVQTIVKVLADSPMRVQIWVARLVAVMAENDSGAQDYFARENVIRPLVTLLSFETFSDDQFGGQMGKQSIHSLVQMNKEMEKVGETKTRSNNKYRPFASSFSSFHSDGGGGSKGGGTRKEREKESWEVKQKLKMSCAEALWMLAKGSVSNSKRITETKGLLCLAKLVEIGEPELQFNCVMTIKEITFAAESNADLRRAAFKANSPAAKAVVDQLLRVIKGSSSPKLLVAALQSMGSLARTFPARETRVIGPLVNHLNNRSQEVAAEAAIALAKFTCEENFLCEAHSKTMIEFNAIPALMKLLRGSERAQLRALILLCYLAVNAGNHEALEPARVLTALEGVDRMVLAQYPELRELVAKAVYHINLYHRGPHSQRLTFVI